MTNALDRIAGLEGAIDIGLTEILGDAAALVPEVDKPKSYTEGKYTIADRIDLGFSQCPLLVAASGALPLGPMTPFTLQAVCSSPFKPERFTIDSSVATDISIASIDIGSARYIEGGLVPGAVYSEVAVTSKISWRTVQTTVPIVVKGQNDTTAPIVVKASIRGFRLV
jgi:hypothetical protein